MSEVDRLRREMTEWADRFGSGRLRLALENGESPRRLYLEERVSYELPGFEVDFDYSRRLEPVADLDEISKVALGSVVEEVGISDIPHENVDVVRHMSRDGERVAVRVQGWEDGLTAFAYIQGPGETVLIDCGFPCNVPTRGDSPLRPTAFASAYGVRHPAAQEALRSAAIVQMDLLADSGGYELQELLPHDARDLIDQPLVGDFVDTLYLVGWMLGQSRRHLLSSFAEQIAGHLLLEQADALLDRDNAPLSVAGTHMARHDIDALRESILDEMFLHEYLPSIDAYELRDLVPAGIESRRASLWAPWRPGWGEPPPRATGDDEREWSLRNGQTPRQAVEGGEERSEDAERQLEVTVARLARASWRLDLSRREPILIGSAEHEGVHSFRPPRAIFGASQITGPWAWRYELYLTLDGIENTKIEPDVHEFFSWEHFFEILPGPSHPLAVDAIFHVIEMATKLVGAVGGHALPGGAVEPFKQSAQALEGVVALRGQLEKCREAGLVRDERLNRRGIRHELFGKGEEMRYIAEARFVSDSEDSFDELQGRFNQTIYDFSPLPISLGIEPHKDDDGSVILRCSLGVQSVDEAFDLAHEVISQVLWRVGLQPIDLTEGEEGDEIGFEIIEREQGGDAQI